ncbi:MAG TPA: hypothetical protein VMZ92_05115 [Planctomycetota bacterium]|nr:hypothetical protein [Planctomycetota bacterium]
MPGNITPEQWLGILAVLALILSSIALAMAEGAKRIAKDNRKRIEDLERRMARSGSAADGTE